MNILVESKVTFPSPYGPNFSLQAHNRMAHLFGTTLSTPENYEPVRHTSEIIPKIIEHGGSGVMPMETSAEGHMTTHLVPFMHLLSLYPETARCPVQVAGAIRMKLSYVLMGRKYPGELEKIKRVLAPKVAITACAKRLAKKNWSCDIAPSSGEAARLVRDDGRYLGYAALGPQTAADFYGLKVLEEGFEDEEYFRTFYLLTPRVRPVIAGPVNRALLVYTMPFEPGRVHEAQEPFKAFRWSHVNNVWFGQKGMYYVLEVIVPVDELPIFDRALAVFAERVDRHILFGPFPVLAG